MRLLSFNVSSAILQRLRFRPIIYDNVVRDCGFRGNKEFGKAASYSGTKFISRNREEIGK